MTKTTVASLLLAASASCFAVPHTHAQSIELIQPPPGRQFVYANAISADGSVVAVTGKTYFAEPTEAPYRWTRQSGCEPIAPPEVGIPPCAISGDGSTIVGSWSILGPSFIAVGTGVFQMVELPEWNDRIDLTGLSADGSFACGSAEFTYGHHPVNAFRRHNPTDTFVQLGVLPGMVASRANAISADGSVVVGSSGTSSPFEADCHAFRWTEAAGIEDLGLLPGTRESWAFDISADGTTIVGACRNATDYRMIATIWKNGGISPLPLLAGGCETFPAGLSADGSVIVGLTRFHCNQYGYDTRATMWSPHIGVVDLNAHLPSVGFDLTGWDLLHATGVSANGRTIIGQGYFNGAFQGFLLTLPPPCGTADFNNDNDHGTDADIEAFFACLTGNCCPRCPEAGADFNADGDSGTDQDIEAFFRVLAGGTC